MKLRSPSRQLISRLSQVQSSIFSTFLGEQGLVPSLQARIHRSSGLEDFAKKAKEKEEELEKKQKEEAQKRREEARRREEERQLEEENARRSAAGQAVLSLEEWRERRERREEVVKTEDLELDEEDKKLLKETKWVPQVGVEGRGLG